MQSFHWHFPINFISLIVAVSEAGEAIKLANYQPPKRQIRSQHMRLFSVMAKNPQNHYSRRLRWRRQNSWHLKWLKYNAINTPPTEALNHMPAIGPECPAGIEGVRMHESQFGIWNSTPRVIVINFL